MPFLKTIPQTFLLFLFILGLSSCVKDVDLGQAKDIGLKPKLQIDLLIFDLNETDFVDTLTNQQKTIIRDTVRLEFLDDSYIQDDLMEVELSFKYINSFSRSFHNKISFLSENNSAQHVVEFNIDPGDKNNPAVTEVIDLIKFDQIQIIRRSIKMAVEIESLPGNDSFTGELKFQSKGLFSFEF
jgi:hypothetical protein